MFFSLSARAAPLAAALLLLALLAAAVGPAAANGEWSWARATFYTDIYVCVWL